MSEERLQEIKDSINLQYKVQEANDLHSFNIFTDEEQELVEEVERLNKAFLDIKEKLERDIKNTEKDIKDNSVSSKYFHNPYGLMFAKGCVSKSKELLDIVNKAIGE